MLLLVKVLNIGFFTAFDRPFKPVDDSGYLGIGIETLRDGVGRSYADLVVVVAAVLSVVVLAIPVLALLRVTRVAAVHRDWALRSAAVLGALWVALYVAGTPVASSSTASLAVQEVRLVHTGLADRGALARGSPRPLRATPPTSCSPTCAAGRPARVRGELRQGRGQGSSFSPGVARCCTGAALGLAAGFSARSAFLPRRRWRPRQLAHSTLQSGITVDGQRATSSSRRTAHPHRVVQARGWRRSATCGNHRAWASALPLRPDLRPAQPRLRSGFGLPPMPDRAASRLQRRGSPTSPRPLFAGVDLISSHAVDEDPSSSLGQVGDGSIFQPIPPAASRSLLGDSTRAARPAIDQYSLSTVFSFVQRYGTTTPCSSCW